MVSVHFDESYDNGVYVVAGYLCDEQTWTNDFEPRWIEMLKRKPALPSLHMKELLYPRSGTPFKNLSYEQRDLRIQEAIDIIRECRLKPIGAVFDNRVFGGARKSPKLKKHFTGIWLATALRGAIKARAEVKSSDKILVYFDRLGKSERLKIASLYQSWLRAIAPNEVELFPNDPIFESMSNVLPLQTADLLAWYIKQSLRQNRADDSLARQALEGVQVAVCDRRRALELLRALRIAELMMSVPGNPPSAEEVLRVAKIVSNDLRSSGLA